MKLIIVFCFTCLASITYSQIITFQDGPWSDPNTWVGGVVPGNTDSVVINHVVNIDANDRCRGVTINNTLVNDGFVLRCDGNWYNYGTYTDNSGRIQFRRNTNKIITGNTDFNQIQFNFNGTAVATGTITVKDWIRMQNGVFDVTGGSLTLAATPTKNGRLGRSQAGNILGTFTAQRYVDRCNEWSWYAGPFDASLSDFASASGGNMVYTGIPGSAQSGFSFVNAYFWDENWSSVGFDGYVVPGNVSDVVSRGTGFWYWNSDTVYSSGQTSIPQQWFMSLSGSIDLTTPFDFTLQYTNTGNTANDGWNFCGNPYPGSLNWDVAGWAQTGLDGALYMYNTCGQSYSSYVGGVGTNGGTRWIPSYQGFYVKAIAASPTLQVTSDALRQNDRDLKTLDLMSNILRIHNNNDEIIIRQNDNASEDFDFGMDAQKFMGENSMLYSKNYSKKQHYSINTIDNTVSEIPVYIKGSGSLLFSDVETWENGYDLTLEDLATGLKYPIYSGFEYPFQESDSLNFVNRFVVHLWGSSLGEDELENDQIDVVYDNQDFIIKSAYSANPVQIEIINLIGQKLYSDKVVLTKEGIRMKRYNQVVILKVVGDNVNKSIKIG